MSNRHPATPKYGLVEDPTDVQIAHVPPADAFAACLAEFRRLGPQDNRGDDAALDFRLNFFGAASLSLPRHLWQVFSFFHVHGADANLVRRRIGLEGDQYDMKWRDYLGMIAQIVGRSCLDNGLYDSLVSNQALRLQQE